MTKTGDITQETYYLLNSELEPGGHIPACVRCLWMPRLRQLNSTSGVCLKLPYCDSIHDSHILIPNNVGIVALKIRAGGSEPLQKG